MCHKHGVTVTTVWCSNAHEVAMMSSFFCFPRLHSSSASELRGAEEHEGLGAPRQCLTTQCAGSVE